MLDFCGFLFYGFTQCFAGLEADHASARNGDTLAGAWVAAQAGCAGRYRETSKTADFYVHSGNQRSFYGLQDGADGKFGVVFGEGVKAGGQCVDDLRAVHGPIVT